MRDCETLREDLKAYMDGELPLGGRLALRLHLARCAECREEMTAMENISRELHASDAGALSPELRERLVGAIPIDLPKTDAKDAAPMKRRPGRPLVLWGTAATAVLLWFVCYPLVNRTMSLSEADQKTVHNSVASESNLKQLGAGSSMYGQDYDEVPANAAGSPGGSFGGRSSSSGFAAGKKGKDAGLYFTKGRIQSESALQVPESLAPAPSGVGNGMPVTLATPPARTDTEGVDGKKMSRQTVLMAKRNPEAGESRRMYKAYADDAGVTIERQVHREGDITVIVDNPEARSVAVEDMVKIEGGGGYVATNQFTTGDEGEKYATMTVKVPVRQFDAFLTKVARLGNVKAKNVSGEDLTEKISDSKQATRVLSSEINETQKRLDRSRNRTQNRLDAEDLRQLRIKNAQQKARLEMLTKMAALATLTITLEEKPKKVTLPPAPQTGGFLQDLRDTALTAGQTFTQAAKLPFILLVWVIIYAPVWLLLLAGYRRFVRG